MRYLTAGSYFVHMFTMVANFTRARQTKFFFPPKSKFVLSDKMRFLCAECKLSTKKCEKKDYQWRYDVFWVKVSVLFMVKSNCPISGYTSNTVRGSNSLTRVDPARRNFPNSFEKTVNSISLPDARISHNHVGAFCPIFVCWGSTRYNLELALWF